jgi:hypothetical protein
MLFKISFQKTNLLTYCDVTVIAETGILQHSGTSYSDIINSVTHVEVHIPCDLE